MLGRRRFLASAATGIAGASLLGGAVVDASSRLTRPNIATLGLDLAGQPVFNVKDYGASGHKEDDARPALQQAIDACGKRRRRNRVRSAWRIHFGAASLAIGRATVRGGRGDAFCLAGREPSSMRRRSPRCSTAKTCTTSRSKAAARIDGQSSYEWRSERFHRISTSCPNQRQMEAAGQAADALVPTRLPQRECLSAPGAAAALQRCAHRRA